jgi:TPR repeat protein
MLRHAALPLAALLALLAVPAGAQDFRLGMEAAERGDYAAAIAQWRPLAEAGDATAQASLGSLYALGQGVPPDLDAAIRWYRLAAGQGHAAAQYNLGQLLRSPQAGDRRDLAEALKWYRAAAEQGNAESHYKLGLMHANGEGGAQDFASAFTHWSIAGALGAAEAARQLDSLTKLMPPDRIAAAQARAAAWLTAWEGRTEEAARLRRALAERERETDRLRREIAQQQIDAAALRQTLAELDSAITGLRAAAPERQDAVDRLRREIAQRENEADAERRILAELDTALAGQRAVAQEQQREADRLQSAIAQRQQEAADLRRQLAALDTEIDGLRAARRERQANAAALATPARTAPADPPVEAATGQAAARPATPGAPVPPPAPATGSTAPADTPTVADGSAAYAAGDFRRALAIWEPLARAGDARAQYHLGVLYYEGSGVARDAAEARHWLGVAAQNGSARARALLAAIGSPPPDAPTRGATGNPANENGGSGEPPS